jgi:hypothetical protein
MRLLIKIRIFDWIYPLLIGILLVFGFLNNAWVEVICAVCAALFWFVQFRFTTLLEKDEGIQKNQCKPLGFFLLPLAAGIIAVGVLLLFWPVSTMSAPIAYGTVAVAVVLLACLLLQMITLKKNASTAGRFLRLTLGAAMSAPLSLTLILILYITKTDEAVTLSCMSVGIFGTSALLVAVDIAMVSLCGYRSTRESIKTISALIRHRKLVFTRITILKDAFLVASKMAISVISLSFFMFSNALYSAGMGIARFYAVRMHTQNRVRQIKSYRFVSIIISTASIFYVIYSVRLFGGGKTETYSMCIALVIALYTFVEFGINIRDAFRLRKSKALEAKALRAISLSSTLLCFVLTQTAIMSFAAEGDNSFANALAGVVFGGLAALVGLYIIVDSFFQKKVSALE